MLNAESSLVQLGLRARSLTMLTAAGLVSVGDLLADTESTLRSRVADKKAFDDVVDCLAMNGLTLREAAVEQPPSATSVVDAVSVVATALPAMTSDTKAASLVVDPRSRVDEQVGSDINDDMERAISETDLRQLEQAFHGVSLRTKRASKATTLTDERRTDAFAERIAKQEQRKNARPTRDDARVALLRETLTLTVDEAAYLYNVSRDAIYDAIKRPGGGGIPHTRIGKRIVISTRHVFGDLGLDG